MTEFLLETIKMPNLPATIMLGLMLIYWSLMIFGIFGADFDADVELGVDGDLDTGFDGGIEGGFLGDVFTFFHLGEVPVMILASICVLFFWVVCMTSNHYFNPDWSNSVAGLWLVPNIVIALLLTKVAVWPLAPLFRGMKGTASTKIIGNQGLVSTLKLDGKNGQVSVEQDQLDGPPIVVNAVTENGQLLKQNQEVKVIRFEEEAGVYIVEAIKPEKN